VEESLAAAAPAAFVTSELTLLEIERSLLRAGAAGRLTAARADEIRGWIAGQCSAWTVLRFDSAVLEAARSRFPKEPVRTLDAMHLAFALVLRTEVRDLSVVSLDERVRENASLLGFRVLP
jgi:predicted nucleic acid-binding protein